MRAEAQSKAYPTVVKLEKALKLAEAWVNGMTGSATDDSAEVDFEGRPSRLGLGAKFVPQAKVSASTDPVEKRLRAKLDGEKKRAAKIVEESNATEKNQEDSDGEDGDTESRTNAFVKKRAMFAATSLKPKKKQK